MDRSALFVFLQLVSFIDSSRSSGITQQFSAYVGEQITLPCQTSLQEPVEWSFKSAYPLSEWKHIYISKNFSNGFSSEFRIEQRKAGEYNLVILNPRLNYTGDYKCEEDAGVGNVHNMHLIVSEIPTYIVHAGQRVRLPCRSSDISTDLSVNWISKSPTKPETHHICTGGQIVSTFTARFMIDTVIAGDNNLLITDAQLQDSGEYTCIENEGRGKKHPMHLIVIDSNRNIVSKVGSMVALGCDVSTASSTIWNFGNSPYGDPANTTVLYDGHNLTMASQHLEIVTSSDRYLNVLRIHNVQPEDGGVYTCKHENDKPSQQSYQLIVLESKLGCNISALNCEARTSVQFVISCNVKYSGALHPSIVCSQELSTNTVLTKNQDIYANDISFSRDTTELPYQCSAVFNASASSDVLNALTWSKLHPLKEGCRLSFSNTDEDKSSTPTILAIVFGILFGLTFVLVVIVLAARLSRRKCRCRSKCKPYGDEDTEMANKLKDDTSRYEDPNAQQPKNDADGHMYTHDVTSPPNLMGRSLPKPPDQLQEVKV